MESLTILLATTVIGEIIDIALYKYKGKKYPKIRKYLGLAGRIAQLLARRK
jgi:hypothetical protein